MRIYNATNGTMNLPMPNGSRLIIGSKSMSRQFYPTVELLNLLVSAYSRDDLAVIMDSAAEVSMGATVSALPGYTVGSPEEAIMRFKVEDKGTKVEDKPKQHVDNPTKVADNKPKSEDKQKESK